MLRKPDWLKVKLGGGEWYAKVKSILQSKGLHTVCEEANCPNLGECFCRGTATFMILGNICTRHCLYCNVQQGTPKSVDFLEPKKVAEAVKELNLKYVVITSVTRDDLKDYGAMTFAKTIDEIRKVSSAKIEVLTPDFKCELKSIKAVLNEAPDVFAHNIETVERLFLTIRPQADYKRSIIFIKTIKELNPGQITKSGFMIGLGETKDEIIKTMRTLRLVKVDILTIGQYLQPREDLAPVEKYYTPEEFKEFERLGYEMGFTHVESGPLVIVLKKRKLFKYIYHQVVFD